MEDSGPPPALDKGLDSVTKGLCVNRKHRRQDEAQGLGVRKRVCARMSWGTWVTLKNPEEREAGGFDPAPIDCKMSLRILRKGII